MSLLEQNIIKKEQVEKVLELNANNKNNKKCKIKTICNSMVYANKLKLDYLPGLYYLVV